MKSVELDKSYKPADFEDRIYRLWEEGGHFRPEIRDTLGRTPDPQAGDDPFTVVIPPPNVTGVLHLGHGLNNSLQDIIIRFHRMLGEKTLWIPGTDHAGIATQSVVERRLREKGIRRTDLGRDKFVEETWKVKEEHHRIITTQLKKIGSSCDWNRERFTLDQGLSDAVRDVFVTLYEQGMIYRGTYLINWSVGMQSALSDDEVEMKEVQGKFYKIRYPLSDGSGQLSIATTRPETLLGDSAVAVHPEDERYRHLVGKTVDLPLTGRRIPVIADGYVDREFGTGVVKITPAHDFNDYEMGKRHDLDEINIMNPDGTLNDHAPLAYRGMSMKEARKAVVADLEALGLFDGADDHVHQVGHCYRTDTIIEPYLSEQWFVRMKPMADKSLAAWERGDFTFFPKRWENTFAHWMRNIRDWCISRQLWWGHRIPVWYDQDSGEMIVSRTDPTLDPANKGRNLKQDEDVLDTWFSSWLWPFSVMGWPEKTADLATYYPTTTLVTGYDIIPFWVSRMIMAGLEFTGISPFRDIYITGLVRDKKGRKMSKTLGNGIDPLEIVDEFGADALKYTLAFLATQGQDILIDKESFGIGSRFANKIWNASRYILMNIEGLSILPAGEIIAGKHGGLKDVDRWILHRLGQSAQAVREAMWTYRFNDATAGAQEFFWNDFCDWYVEASKLSLYQGDQGEKDRAVSLLLYVLEEGLKLLHPFLPFVTEEIFQRLPQNSDPAVRAALKRPAGLCLINQDFPRQHPETSFPQAAAYFASLQELVKGIRTLRSEFTISPALRFDVAVNLGDEPGLNDFLQAHQNLIASLAGLGELAWHPEGQAGREGALPLGNPAWEALLYIKDQIDIAAAVARLEKSIQKEGQALTATRAKLENSGFLAKASAEVVESERAKAAMLEAKIGLMQSYVRELSR